MRKSPHPASPARGGGENSFSPCLRGELEGGKRWRASQTIQQRAKELRKQMTPAEVKLWNALRGNQLDGAYFRRQHAVGTYILDFYCARSKLAIEVDGRSHLQQKVYDAERTEWLETEKGIRLIRFTNQDVLRNLDEVIESVRVALRNPREYASRQ
jgi:very-short-patch-repair endonuclease